jgi:nitrous oxidase accessory protein
MKILLFFLFILSGVYAGASEIIVCHSCEISSVQKAVDLAKDGDAIRIKGGIYKEHDIQIINKSIRIKGEDYPVIDAEFKGHGFSIKAEKFSVEGLKIINIGSSHTTDFAGILISRSKNFSIQNNRMDNIFFGILVERSSGGNISGNIMKSYAKDQAKSGNGIHLWNSSEIKVTVNRVSGMRDGIYIEFGKKCEILKNTCMDNLRYGLHFMFSDHNSYVGNIFQNNGAGVAVMFSKFIEMRENIFRKNWGSASYGLLLKEITDATLKHNVFEDNTIAVNADGTTRIEFIENDFLNNGYAVRVHGGV